MLATETSRTSNHGYEGILATIGAELESAITHYCEREDFEDKADGNSVYDAQVETNAWYFGDLTWSPRISGIRRIKETDDEIDRINLWVLDEAGEQIGYASFTISDPEGDPAGIVNDIVNGLRTSDDEIINEIAEAFEYCAEGILDDMEASVA